MSKGVRIHNWILEEEESMMVQKILEIKIAKDTLRLMTEQNHNTGSLENSKQDKLPKYHIQPYYISNEKTEDKYKAMKE